MYLQLTAYKMENLNRNQMLKFKKKNIKCIIAHPLMEYYIVKNDFASFYWHDKLFIII